VKKTSRLISLAEMATIVYTVVLGEITYERKKD
jgi:hypothetical protein